jgi:DNA-binding NtrC family response regulator
MIVDDHYDIVDVLQIMLHNDDFIVYGYTDPVLALDCFKKDPKKFRLIITDMRMPGMNGVELLVKIKEIQQDTIGFLISAFERDTIENEIKRYNISIAEIFQKPFSLTNLAKSVREYAHINDVEKEKGNKH